MTAILLILLGILACVILSGFFSGSEMAFSSCSSLRLEHLRDDGSKRAGVAAKIAERFEDALGAILIGVECDGEQALGVAGVGAGDPGVRQRQTHLGGDAGAHHRHHHLRRDHPENLRQAERKPFLPALCLRDPSPDHRAHAGDLARDGPQLAADLLDQGEERRQRRGGRGGAAEPDRDRRGRGSAGRGPVRACPGRHRV